MLKTYDYIVPLGKNCEIGIQLKRVFNFVESFPFNWCDVTNHIDFCNVIQNPSVIFTNTIEHLVRTNMIMDTSSGLIFHGNRPGNFFLNIPTENYETEKKLEIEMVKARILHLLNKLNQIQNNNSNRLLYLATIHRISNVPIFDVNDMLIKFAEKLDKSLFSKSANYDLLLIISNYTKIIDFQYSDRVFIKSLKFFSPTELVSRVELSDIDGWDKIFREVRLSNFKIENKEYHFNTNFSNLFFNEGYLLMYPDVARHDYFSVRPWEHYYKYGVLEKRDNGLHPSSQIFNDLRYLDLYPDVKASHMNPWVHYALYGIHECRSNCVEV